MRARLSEDFQKARSLKSQTDIRRKKSTQKSKPYSGRPGSHGERAHNPQSARSTRILPVLLWRPLTSPLASRSLPQRRAPLRHHAVREPPGCGTRARGEPCPPDRAAKHLRSRSCRPGRGEPASLRSRSASSRGHRPRPPPFPDCCGRMDDLPARQMFQPAHSAGGRVCSMDGAWRGWIEGPWMLQQPIRQALASRKGEIDRVSTGAKVPS